MGKNEKPLTPTKEEISRFMAHMGRKGGLKGGIARAQSLSSADRIAIAKKAAKTRWGKNV